MNPKPNTSSRSRAPHQNQLQSRFCRQFLAATTVILCSINFSLAQDEIDPLADLELDPTEVPTENSDARFTDELLRDAEKYATGKGYRYDATRAYELYKKASETGRPLAVFQVAKCLILGEGVKRDHAQGLQLLKNLAKVLVQSKEFRHRSGINPVTQEKFVKVADLKPTAIAISDFTAKDGTAVITPKVLSLNEKTLRMMHSTGISTFHWEELPAVVQRAIG